MLTNFGFTKFIMPFVLWICSPPRLNAPSFKLPTPPFGREPVSIVLSKVPSFTIGYLLVISTLLFALKFIALSKLARRKSMQSRKFTKFAYGFKFSLNCFNFPSKASRMIKFNFSGLSKTAES